MRRSALAHWDESHDDRRLALFAYLSDYQPDGQGGRHPRPFELEPGTTRRRRHRRCSACPTSRASSSSTASTPRKTPCSRWRPSRDLPAGRGGLGAWPTDRTASRRSSRDDDPALRARLAASHVAVIGCGGLGSNAAVMLVRCGVGELTLIDFDVGRASRTSTARCSSETSSASPRPRRSPRHCGASRPMSCCTCTRTASTAENLAALVEGADVVIEAVDRAEIKAMIANAALEHCPRRRS